jgi:hypothetical protein
MTIHISNGRGNESTDKQHKKRRKKDVGVDFELQERKVSLRSIGSD